MFLLQRFDERFKPAVQRLLELVERQFDAVVGHPTLREIVGPDALRSVAAADLEPSFASLGAP